MDGVDLIAGARLWDRMNRREPIVFPPRTPDREGILLVQHRDGTDAFFPSVTVSTDSLTHPGRGLVSVASTIGEFERVCFGYFLLMLFHILLMGRCSMGGEGVVCLPGVSLGVVCVDFPDSL